MNREEIRELLNKEFLSVLEVSRILDVSNNTVIRKIGQGLLDAVNIASPSEAKSTWRIRSDSVKKLLHIEDGTNKLPLQSVS